MARKFHENPNLQYETLIPIADSGEYFPIPTTGSTTFRWCSRGVYGADGINIILETLKVGARRYTSKEAIERFIVAQNKSQQGPQSTVSVSSMSKTEFEAGHKKYFSTIHEN